MFFGSLIDFVKLTVRHVLTDRNGLAAGAEFYGPDGIYPFAGHECARAFALISTDTADCNDNLEVRCSCCS